MTNNTMNAKRKYPIPDEAITLLPIEYNKIHDRIDPLSRQWLLESSLLTPAQYDRLGNTGLYSAYFYSFCTDERRYDALNRQMLNFFIIDDQVETPYGDVDRRADKALPAVNQLYAVYDKLLGASGHVPALTWKPYVLANYAINEHIFQDLNDVQRRRFVKLWTEWTNAVLTECVDLNCNQIYNNIEQFYEIRSLSVAFKPIYHMIEYCYDWYVPEPEWEHPKFQRLLTALATAGVMCNDIYSFEKEVLDARGKVNGAFNGVSVLCRMRDIPVADAMRRLAEMCRDLELEAQALVDEMQTADWACADTRKVAKQFLYVNGGNWKVCTILDRYNTLI